ncbi:MAG: hypothetical protein OEZ65_08115 [Gemmatimonadota bacterium]|nr:hypothetical protein [Gemmatimonadota bacterium]
MRSAFFFLFLSMSSLTGCRNVFGPAEERVLGVIEFHADSVKVDVPDSAVASVAFQVAVTTYGGGCVRQGDTEVAIQGLQARVTPWDIETVEKDWPCPDMLRFFVHVTSVRFDAPGDATVVFRGLALPADSVIERSFPVVVYQPTG